MLILSLRKAEDALWPQPESSSTTFTEWADIDHAIQGSRKQIELRVTRHMGSTQNCSIGTSVASNAGFFVSGYQESRHGSGRETKVAASSYADAQILTCSFTSTLKARKGRVTQKEFAYGCSTQSHTVWALRRNKSAKTFDSVQQQQHAFNCYSWLWAVDNSSSSSGKLSLGFSRKTCPTFTVHSHDSSSKEVYTSSTGSVPVDSEDEEQHNGDGRHNGRKIRNKNAAQNAATSSDGTYIGHDYGSKSDSDVSDLFHGRSGEWEDSEGNRDEDDTRNGESRLEHLEDAGSLPREEGVDDAGYESWGDESDASTRSEAAVSVGSAADSLAIGGKGPVYQVLEVHPDGDVVNREVSRRQLLRSSAGLRLRDIRRVDPTLWVTSSVPALLVRDQAILLNLGSLRAIATAQSVLVFEQKSAGAQAFMEALLPRLRTANNGHLPIMPFELEVVEAALISRTQRLERMLMDVEPQVVSLLKVLPNRYTGDVLEELRLGKQALVELAAKAGALRQMLLELLEHPQDIRKMTIMGRTCSIRKEDGSVECSLPLDKQSAEDEEQEIEMLLEYYLQRCDSCHGQAEKLLDSAKEMEDSIGVSLSSRRLEVNRLELLLQVGTFCSALGALVAVAVECIFGMNLKSYLEEHVMAFYFTTAGIVLGGIALFIAMFSYLKARRIL